MSSKHSLYHHLHGHSLQCFVHVYILFFIQVCILFTSNYVSFFAFFVVSTFVSPQFMLSFMSTIAPILYSTFSLMFASYFVSKFASTIAFTFHPILCQFLSCFASTYVVSTIHPILHLLLPPLFLFTFASLFQHSSYFLH